MTAGHVYGQDFFNYIEHGARRSAQAIAPLLLQVLPIRSVLDVGCGRGVWLDVWRSAGVEDVFGLDGGYVDPGSLLVPRRCYAAADLAKGFRLNRSFDLAQCLEVAEHLPTGAADSLVDSLVSHSKLILFSAAVPGQGGEHHINERPLQYWRDQFARRGYLAVDFVRPAISGDRGIEPWYRYNSVLYASRDSIPQLPQEVRSGELAPDQPLADGRSLWWRLRCAAIGRLPPSAVESLARAKHRIAPRLRKLSHLSG
jgi:SAM-dependent methyltransferase